MGSIGVRKVVLWLLVILIAMGPLNGCGPQTKEEATPSSTTEEEMAFICMVHDVGRIECFNYNVPPE